MVPSKNLLDKEEYVKIKKKDWNVIRSALRWALTKKNSVAEYEKKINTLEKRIATLKEKLNKRIQFIKSEGLEGVWDRFIRPKSVFRELEEKKTQIAEREQSKQRKKGKYKGAEL